MYTNNNKGVVLISVLVVILLLSSIAAFLGNKYFISLKRFAYLEYQTQALNYYRGIESISVNRIRDEVNANKNYLPRNNLLLNDVFNFEANNGSIKSQVKDISNCINVNSLVNSLNGNVSQNTQNIKRFKKLFYLLEIDEIYTNEFIDQIIDWIDKDTDPRNYGVEDYYYTGPLSNPKHYSGMRYFHNIQELKPLPITRSIGWDNIAKYLCAFPISEQSYININTFNEGDGALMASAFSDLTIDDAEYIIFNFPEEGFDQVDLLYNSFQNITFGDAYTNIQFTSNKFNLISELSTDDFKSLSSTIIYFGKNKNGEILLRTYNGI